VAFVEENKGRMDGVLVFNTLEYVAKGGRIGRAQALLGNLLSMKPLVGYRDGVTTPFGRVRTHKQGLNFILERIRSDMDRLGGRRIRAIIEDADNREQANIAEKALLENFDCDEIYHITISIVSGTHIGPGAWGVAYYVL
jgi:DegV family protein with EDD domain